MCIYIERCWFLVWLPPNIGRLSSIVFSMLLAKKRQALSQASTSQHHQSGGSSPPIEETGKATRVTTRKMKKNENLGNGMTLVGKRLYPTWAPPTMKTLFSPESMLTWFEIWLVCDDCDARYGLIVYRVPDGGSWGDAIDRAFLASFETRQHSTIIHKSL